ncbi:MAG: hypothetical protein JOY52_21205 [Hyphomicrobiales bacterium]|jgi:hypothetical protein|nr:hypothetical protein [Hyphomicrobiales bacterium]
MKLSMMCLSICFAFAPIAAHATTYDRHAVHQVRQAQRYVIPKSATAFVPAVKPDDDSDGLSRNHEDCNRGCIDNN